MDFKFWSEQIILVHGEVLIFPTEAHISMSDSQLWVWLVTNHICQAKKVAVPLLKHHAGWGELLWVNICQPESWEWTGDRERMVSGNSSLFLAVVWESWLLDADFLIPGTTGVAALDKTHLICCSWALWLFWSLILLVLCLADPSLCWVSDHVEAGHVPYLSLSSSFGNCWMPVLGELISS